MSDKDQELASQTMPMTLSPERRAEMRILAQELIEEYGASSPDAWIPIFANEAIDLLDTLDAAEARNKELREQVADLQKALHITHETITDYTSNYGKLQSENAALREALSGMIVYADMIPITEECSRAARNALNARVERARVALRKIQEPSP